MPSTRVVTSQSAADRLAAAQQALSAVPPGTDVLVIAASRSAADEIATATALSSGGTFGISRVGFAELVTKLALPELARQGLSPGGSQGDEAVAARAAFEAVESGTLDYFAPVAGMPGFPRALSRTLAELRMADVSPHASSGPGAADLDTLMHGARTARVAAGVVDYAELLATATSALALAPGAIAVTVAILVDVPIASVAEQRFVQALLATVAAATVVVPTGDARTLAALAHIGCTLPAEPPPAPPFADTPALARLQRYLFAADAPPQGSHDHSLVVFSAPGEGREAVEIARRVLQEAARGVPFDDMAVLLRAPGSYLGLLDHALERAGIPAWFHRGTRRPDPAGRAFLALLACAEEQLSARRFAEYVSLGQVPSAAPTPGLTAPAAWVPPTDDVAEALLVAADRAEDPPAESERLTAASRGETPQNIAGTLRAPWRWEDLIVEAAVMGGIDRWRRRLAGLHEDYTRRLIEAESDDAESSRTRGLRRDAEQLAALQSFALPVLTHMSEWPEVQTWGAWTLALRTLAPLVLEQPARVLRVLQELGPLETIGPVRLREVREVLAPRLTLLSHEPPRRRAGRLFVGTPHSARGRSFRVVFVPGLAERMFPQRIREDALLLDHHRASLGTGLATQTQRAADERLQLTLAAGAARERLYISYPRIEISESRPRVPSFYVLDAVRAVEGTIPSAFTLGRRAYQAGGATLAWPAPREAAVAIDAFEHDLSTIGALLAAPQRTLVMGRARYLYDLSPELQRSLSTRWLRWHRRQWDPADGLVRSVAKTTAPALATQRLGARPYSLTALQRYAACPYQFLLAAIYRLAPLALPAPLQRLDPLTKGNLFHQIQADALGRLRAQRMLPVTPANLPKAKKLLEWAINAVDKEWYDALAPAIERVWLDEIAAMRRDLSIWLEHLAVEGKDWTPERFEFAFGLAESDGRDPSSTTTDAMIDGRFRLRGSIDLIERHRQTGLLRVTDHKTGRNRTARGTTIVQGGRVLQPVVYGLAVEALDPTSTVYSGRLSFCTAVGGFTEHEIPLLTEARRTAIEALEIIDRGIEQGLLAARPDTDACSHCDFQPVCGRDEERRTSHKDAARFADLDALRELP